MHAAIPDDGLQRVAVETGKRHGVEVPVQHEAAAAASACGNGHDGRTTRCAFESVDGESAPGEPRADEVGDRRLPGGARHQVGVARVDGDQLGKQRSGIPVGGFHIATMAHGVLVVNRLFQPAIVKQTRTDECDA